MHHLVIVSDDCFLLTCHLVIVASKILMAVMFADIYLVITHLCYTLIQCMCVIHVTHHPWYNIRVTCHLCDVCLCRLLQLLAYCLASLQHFTPDLCEILLDNVSMKHFFYPHCLTRYEKTRHAKPGIEDKNICTDGHMLVSACIL